MMRVELSEQSIKYLKKIESYEKSKILEKIKYLKLEIERNGILPFKTMDIKKLKGDWAPLKRLRIGTHRIIFEVEIENQLIKIFKIDNRGNIY